MSEKKEKGNEGDSRASASNLSSSAASAHAQFDAWYAAGRPEMADILASLRAELSEETNEKLTFTLAMAPEMKRYQQECLSRGEPLVTWIPQNVKELNEIFFTGEMSMNKQQERMGLTKEDMERLSQEGDPTPNIITVQAFAAARAKGYGPK